MPPRAIFRYNSTATVPRASSTPASKNCSKSCASTAPPKILDGAARLRDCRERHHDQFRSSGDPYLTHLLEVAHILADMRLTPLL